MEILTDKDLEEARRQAPPVRIDGVGVDTNPLGNGVRLVLRKASNGGMKIYNTDAPNPCSMLVACRRQKVGITYVIPSAFGLMYPVLCSPEEFMGEDDA